MGSPHFTKFIQYNWLQMAFKKVCILILCNNKLYLSHSNLARTGLKWFEHVLYKSKATKQCIMILCNIILFRTTWYITIGPFPSRWYNIPQYHILQYLWAKSRNSCQYISIWLWSFLYSSQLWKSYMYTDSYLKETLLNWN